MLSLGTGPCIPRSWDGQSSGLLEPLFPKGNMSLSWRPRGIIIVTQIRSDQSLSRVWLFVTPWNAARQASLSITNSQSSLRLTSIESVMPSSHLILCLPLLLLPPIPPSITNELFFSFLLHHQLERNCCFTVCIIFISFSSKSDKSQPLIFAYNFPEPIDFHYLIWSPYCNPMKGRKQTLFFLFYKWAK